MLTKSHPPKQRATDLTSRQDNCLCQPHRLKHAWISSHYIHAAAVFRYLSVSWEKTCNPSRCTIACSGSDGARTGGALGNAPILAYPYNDSDGKRQKATIEHVFPALDQSDAHPGVRQSGDVSAAAAASSSGRPQAPWQMGWQMNERNLYWNDELKVRLIKRIASDELGVSEDAMEDRLRALGALLPGLEGRLSKAPPKLVARLAADPARVAERLLRLRTAFPQANLSVMVSNRLTLLTEEDDPEAVTAAGERLRQLLPELNVDKFVEAFPLVLDVECFERALEDARRIMPGVDTTALLRSNPDIILSLVKGKALLPYDQISNPWT